MKYSTAWTLLVWFISIHSNMPSSKHPAGLVQRRQVRYFLGCTYSENDPINPGWSVVWGQRARKPGNAGSTVVFAWENGFYVLHTCTLLHRNTTQARQDQRMDSLQEEVISFHRLGPRDETQGSGLEASTLPVEPSHKPQHLLSQEVCLACSL